MKINDKICGFQIERIRTGGGLDGSLVEMKHIKTGARLLWLDNKDVNRHFSIAFKTPPTDDTGVFHILEHSVLNGSRRFTVKDPFLELMKSSMHTFLNAMTSSDYTIYPVSSRNEQDFINLVNVYLDAVFCPAIYENRNIFYQEGWHYEMNDAGENPCFKGVVFNEMKGAFASPEEQLRHGLYKLMFPDTCYQYESGGDPKAIPGLTYEQFIETHSKYYHPGNSGIYLDGDVPLEKILKLIDEYLGQYEKREVKFDIPIQNPVENVRSTGYYQADEGEKSYLAFGKVLCSHDDIVMRFSLNILADYLAGNNDSPLKKAVLSEGLAQDISLYLDESVQNQPMVFIAKQMDLDREASFWQTLSNVREDLLQNGIDKEELNAIINQIEFSIRISEEPKALSRNMAVMTTWLYGGDPMNMLAFDGLFKKLRELTQTDYFERLLMKIPFSPGESAVYVMFPSVSKDEELLAEEKEKLERAKASWSEEQIDEILRLNGELISWQKKENTPEDLASLPALPLSAVSPDPVVMPTEINNRIIFHKTADSGITHINLYFSLTGLDRKDYGAVSFLTNLLGELPTRSSSLTHLKQKLKTTIGIIDFNVSAYAKNGTPELCHPYFAVSFSVLNQKIGEAIELIGEIINETDFESEEVRILIEDILNQCLYYMQDSLIGDGNRFAVTRAASHVCAAFYAVDLLAGYGYYEWLQQFCDAFEDSYDGFVELMKKVQTTVFQSVNLSVSAAASGLDEEIGAIFEMLAKTDKIEYPDYLKLELDCSVKREAIKIPGGVSYASLADNIYRHDTAVNGKMYALSKLLTFQYLWNEIRVLGGAYGCGFSVSQNGNAAFYSYRDPDPENSQNVFRNAGEFIREYCRNSENFEKIIISAAASLEPLLDVRKEQEIADLDYFCGITYEDKRRIKKELLKMKKEDLLEFCTLLEQIAENGFCCTVGPKAHIERMDIEKIHTI